MLRKVMTASLSGVDADFVIVEADLQMGLPAVNVVGLADTTIKEAKERIRAAIINSGYEFPRRRITINLSPAGLPKEGSHFDLPIAVGIIGLACVEIQSQGIGMIGELSLDGSLKPIRGALPLALRLREEGVKKLILPQQNAEEAALLEDMELYPAATLKECIDFLSGAGTVHCYRKKQRSVCLPETAGDFRDVRGQEAAKRALMVAAAGNHGVLMMGTPGSGKTMMAKRLPGIMPQMDYQEMLEVTKIYSAAGLVDEAFLRNQQRPFRMPHHSISKAALVGGGTVPRPGEISLAHNGILFLDEFSEFPPSMIDLLRQPVEEGTIKIHRARMAVNFPCRLMLVAAANPCKCGYRGDERHLCTCTDHQMDQYLSRFSGPILDRIDLQIRVNAPEEQELRAAGAGMSTQQMRQMVEQAVERQKARYQGTDILFNGRLEESQLEAFCVMEKDAEAFLRDAFNRLSLSMRARSKLLKVARTIADLSRREKISSMHLAEALQYRQLDELHRR